MNRGIGGQTVGQISARFKSDVLPYRPRYAIIEGGLNDLSSHSLQEFTTAWRYMLSECKANRIQAIVILITPWTKGSAPLMHKRDIWNNALRDLAVLYGTRVVDTSALGQHRARGDKGNLWDIQPQYDLDGIHLTSAGNRCLADLIYESIASHNGAPYRGVSEDSSIPFLPR